MSSPSRLRWGIKASLLQYILQSGGAVEGLGVERTDNEFAFPRIDTGQSPEWHFGGAVHLLAYGGLLDIELAFPIIRANGDGRAEMTLSVGSGEKCRILLGGFAVSMEQLLTAPASPRLAGEAVSVFDRAYPPGTPLDVVRLDTSTP